MLAASGIDRLDAEVLLSHVLKKPRSWLVAHNKDECTEQEEDLFNAYVTRRKDHEPVAYIIGHQEFYGREFLVNRYTLIPRPATEYLVEETLRFLNEQKESVCVADTDICIVSVVLQPIKPSVIIDVGTGSGCIAITLEKEGRREEIIGVDVSKQALTVAKDNAKKHGTQNVSFVEADGAQFLESITKPFLLVSNPPYIPTNADLEPNVLNFEPKGALFAGEKGLDVIAPLMRAARKNKLCTGVVMELRADQVEEVRSARSSGMLPS